MVPKALIESVRIALIDALRNNHGNVKRASLDLMIGHVTLYRKMRDLDIQQWEYARADVIPAPEVRRKFQEMNRLLSINGFFNEVSWDASAPIRAETENRNLTIYGAHARLFLLRFGLLLDSDVRIIRFPVYRRIVA